MQSLTHEETVLRFRIEKHEELPERHQQALRAEGIDPSDNWLLYASAPTAEAAEQIRADAEAEHRKICEKLGYQPIASFRVRDGGSATVIKRPLC